MVKRYAMIKCASTVFKLDLLVEFARSGLVAGFEVHAERFRVAKIFAQGLVVEKVKVPIFIEHIINITNLMIITWKQFYNNMASCNYFSNSEKVINQIVEKIVTDAEKGIQMNKFIKHNQPAFLLKSQENIYNTNLKHILNNPQESIKNQESQPKNIQEDSFMNVGCTSKEVYKQKKSLIDLSLKQISVSSAVQTKRGQQDKKNSKANKAKESLMSKFQFLFKQHKSNQNQQQQWRLRKEEADRVARQSKPLQRPKKECHLQKGQQVVFDFEGNFDKRKDAPTKDFAKTVIQGSLLNPIHLSRHQNKNSLPSPTTVQASNRRVDKGQSKLRSSQDQQYMRQISQNRNNKQELMNSMSICSEGIKVMIDGEVVRNSSVKKSKQSAASEHRTVVMKHVKDSISERFKTQSLFEADIALPNLKRKCLQLKNRTQTEVSNRKESTVGKISIQNMSLHKMVVNEEQGQSRYIGIPNKHSIRRRLKTNVDGSSNRRDEQIQNLKIKDRLTSLMKAGDRLPKIINQHRLAEVQLYKQLRHKLKDQD